MVLHRRKRYCGFPDARNGKTGFDFLDGAIVLDADLHCGRAQHG
jgi:hypothetical protein